MSAHFPIIRDTSPAVAERLLRIADDLGLSRRFIEKRQDGFSVPYNLYVHFIRSVRVVPLGERY